MSEFDRLKRELRAKRRLLLVVAVGGTALLALWWLYSSGRLARFGFGKRPSSSSPSSPSSGSGTTTTTGGGGGGGGSGTTTTTTGGGGSAGGSSGSTSPSSLAVTYKVNANTSCEPTSNPLTPATQGKNYRYLGTAGSYSECEQMAKQDSTVFSAITYVSTNAASDVWAGTCYGIQGAYTTNSIGNVTCGTSSVGGNNN